MTEPIPTGQDETGVTLQGAETDQAIEATPKAASEISEKERAILESFVSSAQEANQRMVRWLSQANTLINNGVPADKANLFSLEIHQTKM